MRSRTRRLLLPGLLALVVAASVAAVVGDQDVRGGAPTASPETPVLSARRARGLLNRPAADAALRTELDGLLAGAPAATCLVVEVGGRRLVEHQGDEPLIPASAMKLVMATAVLTRIGPDERFVTEVRGSPPVDGVVAGDLHVVGGGDPLLATRPYSESFTRQPQLHTPLEDLADRVVEAGVERVEGGVVGDETRYDTVRYVRSWRPNYVAEHATGPMSALTVNDGFASFSPRKAPAAEPAAHAAAVLTELLADRGVEVSAAPDVDEAPDVAALASVSSPTVRQIVSQLLRESDNQTGEMLLKELGYRFGRGGTTAAGRAVVESTIEELGLPTRGLDVVDGSGLDRENRVTCSLLAAVLDDDDGAGDAISGGLAVVGESGTLGDRMEGTPVEGKVAAKTGSLNGVAALAGVAETADGGEAHFAFVTNGISGLAHGNELQDRLMLALTRYPSLDVARLAPVGGAA